MRRPAAILALLLLAAPAMAAEERVGVRSGNHPDRGRIVFDWSARTNYRLEEREGGAVIRFDTPSSFDLPARLPRNALTLAQDGEGVALSVRPGTRLRHFRLGDRVVIDLLDPVPGADASRAAASQRPPVADAAGTDVAAVGTGRGGSAARPGTARGPRERAVVPTPAGGRAGPPVAAAPAPVAPAPAPSAAAIITPTAPVAAPAATAPLAVARAAGTPVRVRPPGGEHGRLLAIELPEDAGLAALRRGDWLLLVSDMPAALDLSPVRGDPVFGALTAENLPDGTLLRLPLAAPAALSIRREGRIWLVEAVRDAAPSTTIQPEILDAALVLRAGRPGRAVALLDPETGLPLLVGPVGEAGQAQAALRRLPRADLLPTLLGAALLARGDGVTLRGGSDRFVANGTGGATVAPMLADSAGLTRVFDLVATEPGGAQERLRAQMEGIAAVAPMQRAVLRAGATEGLLALGLGQEAQSMVRLAMAEDPRARNDPRLRALGAAAALLAGRINETEALNPGQLPPSDEAALWTALLLAARGDAAGAAPGIARGLSLLLSYPEPLRTRLLPGAAEALAAGGEPASARRLLLAAEATPSVAPSLLLARGLLAEAEGRVPDAKAAYQEAGQGRDRRVRARALQRGIELRLAAGELDAAGAAAAMEAVLFAWRGDEGELVARRRLAALRLRGGTPRQALELLRDTEALFPDQSEALREEQRAALVAALEQEPPLQAVALAEANREVLALNPAGSDPGGARTAALVAERFLALDLPDRADALLTSAMQASAGEARAALGTRLASVRLEAGDGPGAEAALASSAVPGLPAPLATEREVLAARIKARRGDEAAIARLRTLGPAGLSALADLLAGRQDWAPASDALVSAAQLQGASPEPQGLVRAAAFAALAADPARSAALRRTWSGRLPSGRLAEAFDLLTADPVRGVADLPVLQRELELFRGFAPRLEALRAEAPSAR